MLNSLLNFLIKKPAWSLALFLIIIGTTFLQIQNFSLDASSESLSLEGDNNLALYFDTQKTFGSDESLVISYTANEETILDTKQISHLRSLRDDLLNIEGINSVISILDVSLFQSPPLSLIELASDVYTIDNGKAELSYIENEFKNSPLYANNLVSSDLKTTALLIPLATDNPEILINQETLKVIIEDIRLTMNEYQNEASLFLGGVPMIRNDAIAYIKSDLIVFSLAVILAMSIMLSFFFHRIRWVVVPIMISIIGALFMTGVISAIGWKVTVISANFFSLLLVMTLSVTIHLVVRYREISSNNPDATSSELTKQTLTEMIKPCTYTVITTIAAFVSLTTSNVNPVIDFGLMMSIGVMIAFVLSFVSFAIFTMLLPKPLTTSHPDQFLVLEKFAIITDRFGKRILVTLIVTMIIAFIGLSKLSVENSFINYFKKDTEIYQGLQLIDKELGGTVPLEIVFNDIANAYWADSSLRDDFHKVHKYLDGIPSIGKVLSIDTFMQVLKKSNNGKTPNGFLLTLGKNNMPEFAKEQILKPHISDDSDQIRIVARIKETTIGLNRNQLINDINNELIKNFNFNQEDFYFTGTFSLYNNLLQSLFESQIKTITSVFVIIFILFLFIFRSASIALIAVLPNVIPSLLILGVMGLANIPLDIMTITIAAIAIGIGIDNAVHYISRFQNEVLKDGDYLSSMYRTHSTIGISMFYTAATVAIGFLVLILSHFTPSIYFGIFMAIAMLSAVIVNLTLLPKLLIIFKPKMNNQRLIK
ncbi:efflux RND transporter permease subunit [Candidatus Pseudothioglobus sp. Uisw_086]|uniref:efflux RND transporter permease subunit n=1 Tax=Candidatus Pseudothioglobus sp. Uisw_086 TaxID=3230998 RepID=UPI003A85A7A0